MEKVYIVYWPKTGNTKEMAEAIGREIQEADILGGEGLICQEKPDTAVLEGCAGLGRQLAGVS